MKAHYLDIGGALAFVEEHGDGPAVLCLHTAGPSGAQWRVAAPALAERGWRVLVPDLPGHGRSEPAPGGPVRDLGDYGAWCAGLLDRLAPDRSGSDKPAVIGCSIGGKIALDLACRRGNRLRGVIAMAADGGLPPAEARAFARSMERELEDSAAPSRSDRTFLGTLAVLGRMVPEPHRQLIATMHRREDPAVTGSDLIGWATFDRWDALPTIRCPVRVVVGEDDLWMSPPRAERTAALIPGAGYTLLPGIGHYPMEEMADMAERLDEWLRGFGAEAG